MSSQKVTGYGWSIDRLVHEEFNTSRAITACGVVVAAAEAVMIPLLRRAAIIKIPGLRSSHTVPTPRGRGIPIAAGLLVTAGAIGSAITMLFAFAVAAFGLLGAASRAGQSTSRAVADLAEAGLVVGFLRSSVLLARRSARGEFSPLCESSS